MKKSEFIKMVLENDDLTSKIANLDDNQFDTLKTAIGAIETLKQIKEDGGEQSAIFIDGKEIKPETVQKNGDASFSIMFTDGTEKIISVSHDQWDEINQLYLTQQKEEHSSIYETKVISDVILDIINENENPRMKVKDIYKFIRKKFDK
jgi:hypothetical protein